MSQGPFCKCPIKSNCLLMMGGRGGGGEEGRGQDEKRSEENCMGNLVSSHAGSKLVLNWGSGSLKVFGEKQQFNE